MRDYAKVPRTAFADSSFGDLQLLLLPNVPGCLLFHNGEVTPLAGGGPSKRSASRRIGAWRSPSDRNAPFARKRRPEGPDASLRVLGRDLRAKRRRRAGSGTQPDPALLRLFPEDFQGLEPFEFQAFAFFGQVLELLVQLGELAHR
jgi:hypothetical protein